MKIRLWLLISSIYTISMHANSILKLYHHKGLHTDKGVLYLRNPVEIQRTSELKDGIQHIRFLLPGVTVSDKIRSALHDMNRQKHSDYLLAITQKPNGLQILLRYNPDKAAYILETFQAIATQFGIQLSIARNNPLAAQKKRGVILDFGHGGDDHGAIGCYGIKEKNITRTVGLKVVSLLEQKGVPVHLTRTADQTVPLNKRTQFANVKNVDLFVSIHANAAANKNAHGIETFCAPPRLLTCKAGACNSGHAKKSKENGLKGCLLAQAVHANVLKKVQMINPLVRDRKVKHAVSQVLAGTQIPATLIELGFVSNCAEAAKLNDAKYQLKLAEGIMEGILKYLRTNISP